METAITSVFAWEALDSRGTPTVGCEVGLRCGARGSVHVPSGASTGKHEARELRDGGERYGGQGVRRAVASVNDVLGPEALELDAAEPESLDAALRALDGTESLERLGANAVLAVSLAATLAAADAAREPLYRYLLAGARPLLPLPMVNVISGGAHARGSGVDVQDFLVVPVGASTFAEAIEWCRLVRTTTEELAIARGHPASLVADEGGLGLPLASNRAGLELLLAGIERAGLAPGEEAAIAVDLAAGQLAAESGYRLSTEDLVLYGGRAHRRARRLVQRLPDRLPRGPSGRGRLGRLGGCHRSSAGHPGRRRRSFRNPGRPPRARHCRRRRERDPPEAEPVRHLHGRARGPPARAHRRIRDRRLSALRRHGGRLARRPRSRLARGADQGRIHYSIRAHGEVEPPAADRGRGGGRGRVCRPASAGDVTDVVCLGLLVADAIARPSIRPTRSVSRRPRAGGTRPGAAARAGSRGRRRPPCRSRERGPSGSALPRPAPRRA